MSAQPAKRRLNKLYIDQHGVPVYARTLKELREKVGGHIRKMYVDDVHTGESFHIGYILGNRWFEEFTPTRNPMR